jgi:hypothetical protein
MRVAAQAKCQDIVDNRSEVLIRNPALIFKSFTRSVPTSYSLPTKFAYGCCASLVSALRLQLTA